MARSFLGSRFKSCPLSERHLYAAIRYVERNPVRAKIVHMAQDYRWSSAKAHVYKTKDKLLDSHFLTDEIKDWANFLAADDDPDDITLLRRHANTGRPLGGNEFIVRLEALSGKVLRRQKPALRMEGLNNYGSCPRNSRNSPRIPDLGFVGYYHKDVTALRFATNN